MTEKELDLLKDMYHNATSEGDYKDPKAEEKAEALKKVIDLFTDWESNYFNDELYVYKTKDKRNYLISLYGVKFLVALYDILSWRSAIYNGKDYGCGSVIYRNEVISSSEWERRRNHFSDNAEIEYDYDKKVYIDSKGEVPANEVHFVYTRDDIEKEIGSRLSDVIDLVYQLME